MVTWENYEEYMLLEADGELDEAGQKELYAFVAQHPELKKELAAYLATRLQPDTQLVFADKDTLLKKGGSSRTISLRNWWVYGAAAAVLLLVAVTIIKQSGNTNMPVAHEQPTPQITKQNDSVEELHSIPANPVTIENIANNEPAKKEHTEQPKKKQQVIPVLPVPKHDEYIAKQTPKPAEANKPTPNITKPLPIQEPENNIANNEQKTQDEPAIVVPLPKEEMMAMATPEKQEKEPLGWLIREDKKESANVIAEAVGQKLEKVKNLRNNLKNTDIAFKIGNKELFVVKL